MLAILLALQLTIESGLVSSLTFDETIVQFAAGGTTVYGYGAYLVEPAAGQFNPVIGGLTLRVNQQWGGVGDSLSMHILFEPQNIDGFRPMVFPEEPFTMSGHLIFGGLVQDYVGSGMLTTQVLAPSPMWASSFDFHPPAVEADVPEPAAWLLLLVAFTILLMLQKFGLWPNIASRA